MISPTKGLRNPEFDLLRIVFAIFVLLSHAPVLTDGNASREPLVWLSRGTTSFGVFGVFGFFLLSGYLISESWDREPRLGNFARKRFLRLVPGYVVAVLLSTLAAGWIAPGIPDFFHHLGAKFVLSTVTMSSPVGPPVYPGMRFAMINGSLWTISYECRCYLLVALFGMVGWLRRPAAWLVATAAVLLLGFVPALGQHFEWSRFKLVTGDPHEMYRLGAVFLVGGSFYRLRGRVPFRPQLAALAAAVVVAVFLLAPHAIEPVLVLAGGYLLFYPRPGGAARLRFMRRIPDVSYGIYLYGWPVESLLIWSRGGSPWVTFLLATGLCFGLGWLSWVLVERPALKLKGRRSVPLPPASLELSPTV